jgi:DNA-binding HxlR family transcriptional regulator
VAGRPRSTPTVSEQCIPAADPLARAFRFLGKRWNAVVLGHLSAGAAGFRERLADLTARGLIDRTVDAGPPLAVSYELTGRGRALMPALEQIAQWARENLPAEEC